MPEREGCCCAEAEAEAEEGEAAPIEAKAAGEVGALSGGVIKGDAAVGAAIGPSAAQKFPKSPLPPSLLAPSGDNIIATPAVTGVVMSSRSSCCSNATN